MELGRIISLILKKRGLTQTQVADKIGKSPTALSQIINGTYNPHPDTLKKICDALDIPLPILYFLTISEDDIPKEKLELYRLFEPTIKNFLIDLYGEKQKNTIENLYK